MKSTITIVSLVILFAGCKQFDAALLNPTGEPFKQKLPAMENIVESNFVAIIDYSGEITGANPQDIRTLFDREVNEIMTDRFSNKRGYLVLKVSTIKDKLNMAGGLLGAYLLTLPNVCGVPFNVAKCMVDVQLDVLDMNRRLLASYRANAYVRIPQSYYSKTNYNRSNLKRVAYLEAVRMGLNETKEKMAPDIPKLIDELSK